MPPPAILLRCALALLLLGLGVPSPPTEEEGGPPAREEEELPTVVVAILARNAQHSLPHYLGALDRLDYPAERIFIWCATDHNVDNTTQMLQEWLGAVENHYRSIAWRSVEEPRSYPNELGPKHWTEPRFEQMMRLKQEALTFARSQEAGYILFADTDSILTNNQTLKFLIAQNKSVVAPMMDSQTYYSNFWCGITPQGYYRRTADYFPTKNRQRLGCFALPMVFGTFLIDLRKDDTTHLAFYPPHPTYAWPFDDINVFAYSCQVAGAEMFLCNQERFGYINVPMGSHQTLEEEEIQFVHLVLEAIVDGPPMARSRHLYVPPKHPTKIGFDEVFLINLARRPDRRQRMLEALSELEIDPLVVDAIDGRALNSSSIKKLGVDLLPGYYDPFSGRTLTKGEVGCFLSHHRVWKEIVEKGLEKSLILEDDIRFEAYFKRRLLKMMDELERTQLDWELIYLGRKQVNSDKEEAVAEIPNLVVPEYSYWTLAYVLSRRGAQKLIEAQPLSKILPVDEFLPIMYDKHPNEDYKKYFSHRDLQAFSIRPYLAYPSHYAGDAEWMSDTEFSTIWDDDSRKTTWSGSQKTLKDARSISHGGPLSHSFPTAPRDEL
ncbi:inactive glycosyltransferase 25 family member 3 [Ahaetulla prasina]|uniref:inactive glycosyltransferase 25 family member 3 n=1 Tax=Ahaetulla prasina TaxID=499056 RepID=UPI0026478509|nr:inactive glycosyltransferase 25 family member 3 [Ahaetulla prasina]